jgi:hypothetical protein
LAGLNIPAFKPETCKPENKEEEWLKKN